MSNAPNVLTAMETVFADRFKAKWLRGDTWKSWRVFLSGLFGLPMDAEAHALFRKHTGRDDAPTEQFREAYAIVGRRGGKSAIASLITTFLAVFRDYSQVLAPGEQGVVMLLAADRRQAQVLLKYINAFFDRIPMLKRMVVSRTKDSLTLTNRVVIEVHTASFRTTRGFTVVAAVCDELAYWRSDESANPDTEILKALRPAMTTIPNALLLCISSPYARRGALWDAHRQFFSKNGADVLVWQADTRTMNPSISRRAIEAEYERDPASARAEYGAEFRTDVEAFLSLEVVEACLVRGLFERAPLDGITYSGFVDPSGGSADAFTLAIGHQERGRAVLDLIREVQPPFSPEAVVEEFADTLKKYRVHTVRGDRYAGEWPRERFAKSGIHYRPSDKTRSEIYLELLPLLTSGKVELLDSKRLVTQLVGLERHTSRAGRDTIDHAPGSHDDLCNAAAGVLIFPELLRLLTPEEMATLQAASDALFPSRPHAPSAIAKPAASSTGEKCPHCGFSPLAIRGRSTGCPQCGRWWNDMAPPTVGQRTADVMGQRG